MVILLNSLFSNLWQKVWSSLLFKGTYVILRTVSCRLVHEFQLRSCKPAWKPRLWKEKEVPDIWSMNIRQKNNGETLFSDVSTLQHYVRRPPGKRYDEKYTIQAIKYLHSQMSLEQVVFIFQTLRQACMVKSIWNCCRTN